MNKILLFCLILCRITTLLAQSETPESFTELMGVLEKKEFYVSEKQQAIARLNRRLAANPNADPELKFEICQQLYQQYSSFIYDSAFEYAHRMIKLAYQSRDPLKIGYAKTQLAFTMISSGMFKETFDTLTTVRLGDLADTVKVDYYALMARALYDLSDYNKDAHYSKMYVDMADRYIDFATSLSDPKSYNFLYLNGLRNLRIQRTDESVAYLSRLMTEQEKLTNHQFAITASTLSFLYLKLGDTTRAINLLAQASISDIKSAVKETSALTSLAQLLHLRGDNEGAYRLINESMNDADFYGAKQRRSDVGAILPIIAATRLNTVEGQRRTLLTYTIGLTLLSLLTVGFAFATFLQFRKIRKKDRLIVQVNTHLQESNTKLHEASRIKEEYLGYYFNINSEYLEKIEKFKKSIEQKLVDKKLDEIRFVMSRIDLKKEREELYYSFDKIFVKLFPDFVDTFNSYFKEEDRFIPEKDQLLTNEMRIFALIRMGISDSDKLAKILGYSVNTIYAYKNRIKSKSILPNDEFEQKIMEIEAT